MAGGLVNLLLLIYVVGYIATACYILPKSTDELDLIPILLWPAIPFVLLGIYLYQQYKNPVSLG